MSENITFSSHPSILFTNIYNSSNKYFFLKKNVFLFHKGLHDHQLLSFFSACISSDHAMFTLDYVLESLSVQCITMAEDQQCPEHLERLSMH